MPRYLAAEGIHIAYEVVGDGDPILLIHGFASNRSMNWRTPGWYSTLTEAGRQVIALDVRGHGESAKPHERRAYDEGELARDVVRLLNELGIQKADVMGYSMGGFITIRLLHDAGDRVGRAIIAGVGENYYGRGVLQTEAIAHGLRASRMEDVEDGVPRLFRVFAEQGRNDLEALALCMTRERESFTRDALTHVKNDVLLVTGEKDTITGPFGLLEQAFSKTSTVVVPKRDHMTTVGDKVYKEAVLKFLA